MKFKSKYHKKHYEAWMLQSEHPEWLDNDDNPLFHGSKYYACDEDNRLINEYGIGTACDYCPIDWEDINCDYPNSIYAEWLYETNIEKRTIMAELIALKEWKIK